MPDIQGMIVIAIIGVASAVTGLVAFFNKPTSQNCYAEQGGYVDMSNNTTNNYHINTTESSSIPEKIDVKSIAKEKALKGWTQ